MTRHCLRLGAALAGLALLAGCGGEQPIGTFDRPEYVTQTAPQARYDLSFLPASPVLGPGEDERLTQFIQTLALGPTDGILLNFVSSGSPELDRQRVAAATQAVKATRTPAEVNVVNTRDFPRIDLRSEVVVVEVLRGGQLLVACPRRHLDPYEQAYAAPIPVMGCTNAANLAYMAARPGDLITPRPLGPSEAATSGAAVVRHWEGNIIPPAPLSTDSR